MSIYKYEIQFEVFPDPMGLKQVNQKAFEAFSSTPYFDPKDDDIVVMDKYGLLCIQDKRQVKGLRKICYFIDITNEDNLIRFNQFFDLINLNLSREETENWTLDLITQNEGEEKLIVVSLGNEGYKFALKNMRDLSLGVKNDRPLNLFLSSFLSNGDCLETYDKFIIEIKISKSQKQQIDQKALQAFSKIPQFNPKKGYVTVIDKNGFVAIRDQTHTEGLNTRKFIIDLSGAIALNSFNLIPNLYEDGSEILREGWSMPVFEERKNGCIDKIILVTNSDDNHTFAFADIMEQIRECKESVDLISNDAEYISLVENPDLLP